MFPRIVVEVPNDLHVVRHEADGRHHDVLGADLRQGVQVLDDVGSEPRNLRRAASTLIDQLPSVVSRPLRDEPRGLFELLYVVAGRCHGIGNAVRSKRDAGRLPPLLR